MREGSIATIEGLEEASARPGGRRGPGSRRTRERLELSFELFPPAAAEAGAAFQACVDALEPLEPSFVSVTYGAGGTTRSRTLDAVSRLAAAGGVPVAAHLTCVGASRAAVDAVVQAYADAGVRHIVALRGDVPRGATRFEPHPQGYRDAAELVAAIARRGDFDVSVACYPEVHPEARSARSDLEHLKRKVDAGASRAISQFFFDPDVFLRFVDRARSAGIGVPILPGILPVHSIAGVKRIAARCGARVPRWLEDLFSPLENAPELRPLVAATVCAEMCTRLVDRGVRRLHFYTLNRPELAAAVCHVLGRGVPAPVRDAVAVGQ